MDLTILRKKISTFKTESGKLMNVSDELLVELLVAWESWAGTTKGFYSALGVSQKKMAKLIGRAKKLKREGAFPESQFKEIKVLEEGAVLGGPCQGIEISWDNGKLIRFPAVDQLVEFLRAVEGSCTAPSCSAKKVA